MSSPSYKFDDSTGFVRPSQEGPTRISFPYIAQGDRASRIYARTLLQRDDYYQAADLGFERDSAHPDGDPSAYLISENPGDLVGIANLRRFTRTYARIPAVQTTYGSRVIDRPILHNIKSGTSYAVSFDNGDSSWVFSSRKSVSALGAPAIAYTTPTNARATIGHQQITVELNTGTQSFYLDDTDATIKDAMSTAFIGSTANAANFYVSRWEYGVYISWAGVSVALKSTTITAAEIEIGDGSIAAGSTSSSGPLVFVTAATTLESIRTVSSTSHAAAAGNRVALYNADRIVALSSVVTAATDSFTIRTEDLPGASAVVTHCVFDKDGTRYANGPVSVTVKEVTTFYLPGVTPAITTPADIPLASPKLDPVSWLGEIVAASAYAAVEGSKLDRWLDGPIYRQTTISAQMSDALDTLTASA